MGFVVLEGRGEESTIFFFYANAGMFLSFLPAEKVFTLISNWNINKTLFLLKILLNMNKIILLLTITYYYAFGLLSFYLTFLYSYN